MIRLHRRDHAAALRTADQVRPQVLGVLDAEPPVRRPGLATRKMASISAFASVADGVDGDVELGASASATHFAIEPFDSSSITRPRLSGLAGERLVERRRG